MKEAEIAGQSENNNKIKQNESHAQCTQNANTSRTYKLIRFTLAMEFSPFRSFFFCPFFVFYIAFDQSICRKKARENSIGNATHIVPTLHSTLCRSQNIRIHQRDREGQRERERNCVILERDFSLNNVGWMLDERYV